MRGGILNGSSKNKTNGRAGFTLLELLIVVTIIGVLAGIVIVSVSGGTESANIAKGKSYAQQVHALLGWEIRGQWNFDENASGTAPGGKDIWDYSGYGNHGTIGGNPQWVKSQIEGYALEFDGDDDYVNAGNGASLNITDVITMETWVKVNVFSNTYPKIVTKLNQYQLSFTASTQTAVNSLFIDGAFRTLDSGTTLSPNVWYHIVGTFDSSLSSNQQKIYINGVLDNQQTRTGTISSTSNVLLIGNYEGLTRYLNGLIDEVRIYADALPSAEIQKHYVQGLNKLLANNAITEEEYDQRMAEFNPSLVTK